MTLPPDTLNDMGVLKRREIEARILMPLIDSLSKEFGREKVLEIVRQTIIAIARGQGAALAQRYGNRVNDFAESLTNWKKDDALEIDVLEQNDGKLSFNVTRCRYAEMYRALGIPELGAILSCNRDESLVEGFNDDIKLSRTQTIMQGAACCDFRYEK
ncbi:MAG: L-2-amino-thiazoline-4-carboxylic acid hydrolase [Chloroflexota bacterium]